MDFITCDRMDCYSCDNGRCLALAEAFEHECPFYKKMTDAVIESGALSAVPSPDWKTFRRHSGTHPVTVKDIADWLARAEDACPTDNPRVAGLMVRLFKDTDAVIAKETVINRITEWLKTHPEGCGYQMSPESTAKLILNKGKEVSDDEDHGTQGFIYL